MRENGISEQTETFQVHLRLPFQQRGVVLENATATVFIIDNDGTYSSAPNRSIMCMAINTLSNGLCTYTINSVFHTPADVTVRFELFQYQVNESAGVVPLRLILTGETSQDVAVAVTTSDGEAHGESRIH